MSRPESAVQSRAAVCTQLQYFVAYEENGRRDHRMRHVQRPPPAVLLTWLAAELAARAETALSRGISRVLQTSSHQYTDREEMSVDRLHMHACIPHFHEKEDKAKRCCHQHTSYATL